MIEDYSNKTYIELLKIIKQMLRDLFPIAFMNKVRQFAEK